MVYARPEPVNKNLEPGSINKYLGPGPVNTNWVPGPVNTDWRPGSVNINQVLGLGAGGLGQGWDPGNTKTRLEFLFNFEYCEIFKSTYFEEHLQTAASENVPRN